MLTLTILGELLNNVTFLLMLTIFYNFLVPYLAQFSVRQKQGVQGVLFGLMAILSTVTSDPIAPGYLLDSRNIMIALSGVFGGPAAAVITTVMTIIYRVSIGGIGTTGAVASAVTVAVMGIGFHYRYRSQAFLLLRFIVLGLFIAIHRLGWTYLLGGPSGDEIIATITLPLLLVYPLGTLMIASLIRWKENNYEMQKHLLESEAYFRHLAEATFEGIVISEYGKIVEANSRLLEMLEYPLEEIIGMQAINFIPPQCRAEVHEKMKQGYDKPYQTVLLRKNGTHIPVEACGKTITYKGRLCRVTAFRDLSERFEVHEKLAQERDMLRTLIDNLPDYIFVKDAEGRFVVSNNAHTEATQKVSILGKTAFEVFPSDLAAQYHSDDMKVIESGEGILNVERTSIDSSGNPRIVLTTKVPLKDFSGATLGLIGISRDITERKGLEKEKIRNAIERERVVALQKFIRDISHDLRTPLTVINTSMYIIGRSVPPEQQHRVSTVTEQVKNLTTMLDKINEMSRLESESNDFHFKPTDINLLVERVYLQQQRLAETQHQQLTFQPQDLLPMVVVDEVSLKVSIESIVKNALRYTPAGGKIHITTVLEANHVMIAVQDNGMGIGEKDQERIFDHFYKADQARGMDNGSVGLGLSIARKIVEHHNGRIEVESRLGEGSTFKILLPVMVEEKEGLKGRI